MAKVKSKLDGTKNIPPIYAPNVPMGKSPFKVTSAITRPETGIKKTSPNKVPVARWGGPTRGGGSTINPTGTNK